MPFPTGICPRARDGLKTRGSTLPFGPAEANGRDAFASRLTVRHRSKIPKIAVQLLHAGSVRPAFFSIPVSDRGALRRLSRLRCVELPFALFYAASPLVPGKGGADMVWASALACGGDLLLSCAVCQGKDLIVEAQRATLAASRFCNPSARALTRWRCSGCLP
jgi:hypothetical protein